MAIQRRQKEEIVKKFDVAVLEKDLTEFAKIKNDNGYKGEY